MGKGYILVRTKITKVSHKTVFRVPRFGTSTYQVVALLYTTMYIFKFQATMVVQINSVDAPKANALDTHIPNIRYI